MVSTLPFDHNIFLTMFFTKTSILLCIFWLDSGRQKISENGFTLISFTFNIQHELQANLDTAAHCDVSSFKDSILESVPNHSRVYSVAFLVVSPSTLSVQQASHDCLEFNFRYTKVEPTTLYCYNLTSTKSRTTSMHLRKHSINRVPCLLNTVQCTHVSSLATPPCSIKTRFTQNDSVQNVQKKKKKGLCSAISSSFK